MDEQKAHIVIDRGMFTIEERPVLYGEPYLGTASLIAHWSDEQPSKGPRQVLKPIGRRARARAYSPYLAAKFQPPHCGDRCPECNGDGCLADGWPCYGPDGYKCHDGRLFPHNEEPCRCPAVA